MAANRYGIDLAGALGDAERIKSQRTQNAMSGIALSETKREIEGRPEKERLAKEKNAMLTGLRQKSAGGDNDAQNLLISLDPENGPKFIEAVSTMNENQRKNVARTIDEIGSMSSWVKEAKDPNEAARRYALMYQGVSDQARQKLPEAYDPAFIELSLQKALTMEKILENPQAVIVGGDTRLYKNGQEIDREAIPQKGAGGGSGSGGGLESSQESLIYRQAAGLLGGTFDAQGNLLAIEPGTSSRIQEIATEASKIKINNPQLSVADSVAQAAKKFGFTINEPESLNAAAPDLSNMSPDEILNMYLGQ